MGIIFLPVVRQDLLSGSSGAGDSRSTSQLKLYAGTSVTEVHLASPNCLRVVIIFCIVVVVVGCMFRKLNSNAMLIRSYFDLMYPNTNFLFV